MQRVTLTVPAATFPARPEPRQMLWVRAAGQVLRRATVTAVRRRWPGRLRLRLAVHIDRPLVRPELYLGRVGVLEGEIRSVPRG